jgi:hypothetical protein
MSLDFGKHLKLDTPERAEMLRVRTAQRGDSTPCTLLQRFAQRLAGGHLAVAPHDCSVPLLKHSCHSCALPAAAHHVGYAQYSRFALRSTTDHRGSGQAHSQCTRALRMNLCSSCHGHS